MENTLHVRQGERLQSQVRGGDREASRGQEIRGVRIRFFSGTCHGEQGRIIGEGRERQLWWRKGPAEEAPRRNLEEASWRG